MNYIQYIHPKSCSLTLCSPNPDLHSHSSPLQSYNGLNPDKSWQLFLTNKESNTAVILLFFFSQNTCTGETPFGGGKSDCKV